MLHICLRENEERVIFLKSYHAIMLYTSNKNQNKPMVAHEQRLRTNLIKTEDSAFTVQNVSSPNF